MPYKKRCSPKRGKKSCGCGPKRARRKKADPRKRRK